MHDLVHDLAKEVAGKEIVSCNYSARCFNEKTRHLYIDDRSTEKDLLGNLNKMKRIRTILSGDIEFSFKELLRKHKVSSGLKYLRVLGLIEITCNSTESPKMIGKLVHLRYLDLTNNKILLELPSSITKLYNLQTLKLHKCVNLKRLPRDLRKLVNLRHLDISGCEKLTHMPPGMNTMTSHLQNLTGFVVSGSETNVSRLKDLDDFINHSRTIEIWVKKGVGYNNVVVDAEEKGFLFKSEKLREIKYYWDDSNGNNNNADVLLQSLQPNSNLRKIELWDYPGMRFPSWGDSLMNLRNCLPYLVEIDMRDCSRLEQLPLMSQLLHLKVLHLKGLKELEYVEGGGVNGDEDELVFFPSLEKLMLMKMPKLKGWWKPKSESRKGEIPQAPKLSHLRIQDCPNLTSFPVCPELEELRLYNFNEELGPIMRDYDTTHHALSSSSSVFDKKQQQQQGKTYDEKENQGRLLLREVKTDNVGYLISLPIHSKFHNLSILLVENDQKLDRSLIGKVFQGGRMPSLCALAIKDCKNLESISARQGVWEHFTALENLALISLPELNLEDGDDDVNSSSSNDAAMPWKYIAPTLQVLLLIKLPKVVKLPKGIGCLSSLEYLIIRDCKNLESLTPSIGGLSSLQGLEIADCPKLKTMPEEMRHLTSLVQLKIWGCSLELKNEFDNKNSANWSYIKHIPDIFYSDAPLSVEALLESD